MRLLSCPGFTESRSMAHPAAKHAAEEPELVMAAKVRSVAEYA